MNNAPMTYGNLALATPAAAPARAFSVIEGGKREVVAAPSRRADVLFAVRIAATVLIVAFLAFAVFHVGSQRTLAREAALSAISLSEVKVQPGESLWSIAEDHAVAGISTDDMVRLIKRENGLESGTLHPGQRLLVAR